MKTNPIDQLDENPWLLGLDSPCSAEDSQAEIDFMLKQFHRRPGRPRKDSKHGSNRDKTSTNRSSIGQIIELDLYENQALVAWHCPHESPLHSRSIYIRAGKMAVGMWDVLQPGDVIEFDVYPDQLSGYRARFCTEDPNQSSLLN